jgi:hypothetical protein
MNHLMSNLVSKVFWFNPINGLRRRLNSIEITDMATAQWICNHIPARCPFERRINCLGYALYIPPLCKLNPFYGELVELRLRAVAYLMNEIETVDLGRVIN